MNSTNDTDEALLPSEISLLSIYCIVLVVGVLANASLSFTVCGQHGSRNKSPLLLGLCVADLLVCCLSVPLTMCLMMLATKPWPFAAVWCKFAFFLQAIPVAASTLSLMLVSIDRYVTVKYPRPVGKFQYRRNTVTAIMASAWFIAVLVNSPLFVVRHVSLPSTSLLPLTGNCIEEWNSIQWRRCFVFCHLVIVYVVPCVTILSCHIGLRAKLTALSLTARAAHGELPLPVPLLRRPTHVIIVAGIPNKADGEVMAYQSEDGSSDAADRLVETVKRKSNCNESRRLPTGPCRKHKRYTMNNRTRRATKSEHEIREENRRLRPHQHASTMSMTTTTRPVASTLRSRRRLANALVSAALVFIGCWLPHMVFTVCAELCAMPSAQSRAHQMMPFGLLLGHAHSVINPMVYWALNHQSLQNSCLRISLLGNLRLPLTAAYRNASSTNEAALGPFHPRFARPNAPNPNPHPGARRHSSCYLYL